MRIGNKEIPYFLQYEITYACQAHCSFCYNPTRKESTPPMELVWKIVESIKNSKIPHVQLIGGEVTLIPELPNIIKSLSESVGVTVVTNAIKKIQFPDELLALFISLHGSKREVHEGLTTTDGTYERICKNITAYADEGRDVSADVLLSSKNYFDIYNIVEKAYDLGMKRVFINRFEPGGIGSESLEALMPTVEQFREALTQIIRARDELGARIELGTSIPFCADSRLITEGFNFNCGAGTWFGAVDPRGNLRICNQSRVPIGNVLEKPVEELWNANTKYMESFRNLEWVNKPCSDCPLLNECLGGCRIDVTCNSERVAQIDYYLRSMKVKPNFEELDALKKVLYSRQKVKKRIGSFQDMTLNEHIKIVNRRDASFLLNQEIGVVKIDREVEELVRRVYSDQYYVNSLDLDYKDFLYNLGILVPKERRSRKLVEDKVI